MWNRIRHCLQLGSKTLQGPIGQILKNVASHTNHGQQKQSQGPMNHHYHTACHGCGKRYSRRRNSSSSSSSSRRLLNLMAPPQRISLNALSELDHTQNYITHLKIIGGNAQRALIKSVLYNLYEDGARQDVDLGAEIGVMIEKDGRVKIGIEDMLEFDDPNYQGTAEEIMRNLIQRSRESHQTRSLFLVKIGIAEIRGRIVDRQVLLNAAANSNVTDLMSTSGHASILIIDHRTNVAEYFDPNGVDFDEAMSFQRGVNIVVKTIREKLLKPYNISLVETGAMCPRGLQRLLAEKFARKQAEFDLNSLPRLPGDSNARLHMMHRYETSRFGEGSCLLWSLMMAHEAIERDRSIEDMQRKWLREDPAIIANRLLLFVERTADSRSFRFEIAQEYKRLFESLKQRNDTLSERLESKIKETKDLVEMLKSLLDK